MNLSKTSSEVIFWTFVAIFFAVPFAFFPYSFELFEFNKMMLTYALAVAIGISWLVKMIAQKRLIFKKTPLFWPLMMFLSSQVVSTLFSIHPQTSVWGYYSRFHGGLMSTLTYLLLYFALVSNLKKSQVKKILYALLASSGLIAFYGILEHFGIDKDFWVQDVQNRVFSTLGQPNWLAAWLTAIIPVSIALILKSKQKHSFVMSLPRRKLIKAGLPRHWLIKAGYLSLIILYACLLFTKSRSGLIAFAFSWLSFWGLFLLFSYKKFLSSFKKMAISSAIVLALTLIIGSPWTPSLKKLVARTRQPNPAPLPASETQAGILISESGDIRKVVWKGAINVWQNWPVTGSGVETFAYSYYNFRPREHNDLSEWDFLYNKAHNEYLNFLSTTGVLGLTSYLVLILFSLGLFYQSFKNSQNEKLLILGLTSGWISILITNFFGFSVVAVATQFFLYPGIAWILAKNHESKTDSANTLDLSQIIMILGSLTIGAIMILRVINLWRADYLFAQGKRIGGNQPLEALPKIERAIKIAPKKAIFHNEMAKVAAVLAKAYHQQISQVKANPDMLSGLDQDQAIEIYTQNRDELIQLALAETETALSLNPVHVNFYKSATKAMVNLAEVDTRYYKNAVAILKKALTLAPTDAKLYFNLGVLQNLMGSPETAVETLKTTIKLKPNYAKARHALAEIYSQLGKKDLAAEQMKYILEKINPNDEKAKKSLETWKN